MPESDHGKPSARGAVYRTFPLNEELRQSMSRRREQDGQTMAEFLREAITTHLPDIVAELTAVGIPAHVGAGARPARLPMNDVTIVALKVGAHDTGVPATRLLAAAIDRASRE